MPAERPITPFRAPVRDTPTNSLIEALGKPTPEELMFRWSTMKMANSFRLGEELQKFPNLNNQSRMDRFLQDRIRAFGTAIDASVQFTDEVPEGVQWPIVGRRPDQPIRTLQAIDPETGKFIKPVAVMEIVVPPGEARKRTALIVPMNSGDVMVAIFDKWNDDGMRLVAELERGSLVDFANLFSDTEIGIKEEKLLPLITPSEQ